MLKVKSLELIPLLLLWFKQSSVKAIRGMETIRLEFRIKVSFDGHKLTYGRNRSLLRILSPQRRVK